MTTYKDVAAALHADLKAGKLAKIGMDEINSAIRAVEPDIENVNLQIIQSKVLREVVELAAREPQGKQAVGNAELDAGVTNHDDPNKRGFSPR